MEIRFQQSPKETAAMNTQALRESFLCDALYESNSIKYIYTHYDRVIIGGALPVNEIVTLENHEELKAKFFLERRELGIINVAGSGTVEVDGTSYSLEKLSCLYVGKGVQSVKFASNNAATPAKYFLLSAPAHQSYPTTLYTKEQALPVALGSTATSNERTIYKYIHEDGIQSCQLVMGLTVLQPGSVWNSVPPHTHTRRMEVYFYFDVSEEHRVFHFMGQPHETRHIVVANHQAVISAPWSMHFGSGTSNYAFIWGMAGENKQFTDMDPAPIATLL
jgi:4-deoxy-L-threo-5-hexosulose-uronate ketol-isomerase